MLKQLLYCASILLPFLAFNAWAADSQVGTLSSPFLGEQSSSKLNKAKLEASVNSFQYFSAAASENGSEHQAQFEIDLQKNDLLDYKFNGIAGTLATPKSSYVAIPEAYVGYSEINANNFVAIGRKIQNLSYLDQQQNLGIVNPYFSNDGVEFRQQGLVGLHAGAQIDNVGFYAGYYPLYIPNQGPQVYADNGEIKTVNRWAKKPPKQFLFSSQNHDIVYAIRDYKLGDVVNHDGYGASVYWANDEGKRPWMQFSYTRKPISEIPLSRDTFATADDFVGQVNLSPVVEYTRIQAVDVNLDIPLLKTTFSYLEDHPENKTAAENEALQFFEPLKIYGFSTAMDLGLLLEKTFVFELSYAEVSGGEIRDLNSDGSENIFTFSTQRTQFKKPFSVAIKSDLFFVDHKPVFTKLKWTYDRELKGSMLSGLASYEALKHLYVNAGFDILGVENETSTSENNFFQDNQSNDRIFAGLQYGF